MVKVDDFWKIVCEDNNYRFFTGIAFKEFELLYNTMNKDFMYYVPAGSPINAYGIAKGVSVAGGKSAVFLKNTELINILSYVNNDILCDLGKVLIITNYIKDDDLKKIINILNIGCFSFKDAIKNNFNFDSDSIVMVEGLV